MDVIEQRALFDKLVAKAKRADLLKFNRDGVAVLVLPPPSPTVAPAAAPVAPTVPVSR